MTKFLVVFDVDSTLIEQEAIELLAERSGKGQLVAEITSRAMNGELDFATSLIERVSLLEGLPESELEAVSKVLTPTKGAAELVTAIHARGGKASAVSGGFFQLLPRVKQSIGFDFELANTLEVQGGRLTGKLVGPIIDRQAKADALLGWAQQLGLAPKNTIAIGDGANDLGMMEVAGLSVAFCAKPIVRQQANVSLNQRDLSLLIQLLP